MLLRTRGGWSDIASGAAVGSGVAVMTLLSWQGAVVLVAGSLGIALALVSPPIGFGLFLLIRGSLDVLTERGIEIAGTALNPAGVIALGLVGFAFLVRAQRRGSGSAFGWGGDIGTGYLTLILIALIGAIVGTVRQGPSGGILGLKEVVRHCSVFAVFYLGYVFSGTVRSTTLLIRFAFASLIIPGLVAGWELATGTNRFDVVNESLVRVGATFAHPNAFALYLMLFLVLTAGLLMSRRQHELSRWALVVIFALLSVFLVLTYSRTRLLASLLGLAVLGGVRGLRRAIPILITVAAVGIVLSERIQTRFSDISLQVDTLREVSDRRLTLGQGQAQNSLEWRLLNWMVLADRGRQALWFGHGAGTTPLVNPIRVRDATGRVEGYGAHNDAVETFVEYGLVGLCGLALFLALLIRGLRRMRLRFGHGDSDSALYHALVAATPAMIVAGVAGGHVLRATATLYVFMLLAGIVRRRSLEAADRPDE